MLNKTKKGFTLLELIVAMAIIAVLMGLSLFGIQSVQRSQRDTERRSALSNINLEIAALYGDFGQYPPSGTGVTINGTTVTIRLGTTTRTLTLKGAAIGAANTTIGGTAYCYSSTGGSYQLGVKLESSDWGAPSTAQQLGNAGACGAGQVVSQ